MPGRDFASPSDFDAQFTDWLRIANARMVRTIKTRPVDRLEADKAAMLPLPPVAPAVGSTGSGWAATTTSASTPVTTPWTLR